MDEHKKILLQELQSITQSFCDDRLSVFLEQLTCKHALLQIQPEETNALTIAPLPQTEHADFLEAFKASIAHAFIDFQDLLEYDAGLLEFTETTHDAVMGDLALPAMLTNVEQRFTELLTNLNERLATIAECTINIGTNPVAPVYFALALESAAQNLRWNLHTRVVALKVFDVEFLNHLGKLYAHLDQYLGGQAMQQTAEEDAHIESGSAAPPVQQPSLDEVLPAASNNAANQPPVAEIPTLHEAVIVNAATQPVDYVNNLFSGFLDKRSLGEHLVNLFSDLYLPYVRLASADATFIDADNHPAKHLLNGLAKACKIYQENADDLQKSSLVLEMKAVVRRVSEAGEPSRETFADVAFRFSASLRQHERQVAKRTKNLRLQRSGLRHLDSWKQHVSHVIRSKLEQHSQPVPEAVRLFLAGPWMNYMAGQYLSAATRNVQPTQTLALVDEILTYVAPASVEDVLEFTAIGTPVRESLVACEVDETEIKQFLLQLMHFHRIAVRNLEQSLALAE